MTAGALSLLDTAHLLLVDSATWGSSLVRMQEHCSEMLLLTPRTASQLHVVRPRADLARVLIAAAPFLAAMLIAVSRLEDYRHDVFDVVVGSSLGLALAYFNWRRYYPALSSRNCATPHPSPVEGNPVAFSRIRDEEEGLRNAEEFELSDEDAHFSSAAARPYT